MNLPHLIKEIKKEELDNKNKKDRNMRNNNNEFDSDSSQMADENIQ